MDIAAAVLVWVVIGIAASYMGRALSSRRISLRSYLPLGIVGAVVGGLLILGSVESHLAALVGSVVGALLGVGLVGAIGEIRTRGPGVNP